MPDAKEPRTAPDAFILPPISAGNFYRHLDGGCYQVISRGKNTETGEEMVAYIHRFPLEPMWSFRNVKDFDDITDGRRRFTPISVEEAQAILSVDHETAKHNLKPPVRHVKRGKRR